MAMGGKRGRLMVGKGGSALCWGKKGGKRGIMDGKNVEGFGWGKGEVLVGKSGGFWVGKGEGLW